MASQKINDALVDSLTEDNARLKRAVEELTILNDLARAIGAINNLEEIMRVIIRRSIRAVDAEQGVISLVESDGNEGTKTLVRTISSSKEQQPFHLHQNLLGWMHINKKTLLISDIRSDPRFRGIQWDQAICSLLSVPLMIKSKLVGILTVYNKKHKESFTEEDQRLLSIIAAQSAQIIENARLYEKEKALLKLQHDVEVASIIQKNLLPDAIPEIPNYQISGRSMSAQMVGGDYFDFIPIDDHRIAFCLGDVAGKGLSASLLMANLQATIRSQTKLASSAKDCLERTNNLLYHCISRDRFATCFYGILDYHNNQLTYSNAGHNAPLFIASSGDQYRFEAESLVLGMFEHFKYTEKTIPFERGDTLVVFSDGVVEARDDRDEEFGDPKLISEIMKNRNLSADKLIDRIINATHKHMGHQKGDDDITLIVVKRE